MARPARSGTNPEVKRPTVVDDQRPINKILPRSREVGSPKPIRTVLYIEVQDTPAQLVSQVCKDALASFQTGHPHYVCIMRYGKVTTDFEFEGEFLNTVRRLCEVKDGQIVLKGGAKEVDVIRRRL